MSFFGSKKKTKKEEEEEESSVESSEGEDESSSEEEETEVDGDDDSDSDSDSDEEESDDDDDDDDEEEESDDDDEEEEEEESDDDDDDEEDSEDEDDDEESDSDDEEAVVVSSKAGKKGKTITAKEKDPKRLAALERKAVAEATATADKAFAPSPTLLNHASPKEVMKQVDGPSLKSYKAKDNVYVGKSVPVPAGSSLVVPIPVAMPGSVVEYTVDLKNFDISFGITAERDEGITVVKEQERTDKSDGAISGKFLVGTVPCTIQFSFENEYSWFREKVVTYKVTVTPPTKASLVAGRQRRAKACLAIVDKDVTGARKDLNAKRKDKKDLKAKIDRLRKDLQALEKSMDKCTKEEAKLQSRVQLRQEQSKLLQRRVKDPEYEEAASKKASRK